MCNINLFDTVQVLTVNLVCFWKFGPQCPTSPLLPPRKAPLEDFDGYRKLSHSFEEAKAENVSLKSSSAESSSDEQEDADTLKTELSKLQAENELLRNEISELKAEVAKSTVELSTWNKANITLQKICEKQKQASDKTGIGFSDSEFL
ncbi:hypothetical protein F511_13190 [Dorcoceras hygrometricum]|uniref:Uncharacterized protein n=1 Tax=Dorcoceras hygrometricum TaxID=472368 RepID=A0A2Z7B8I1_9LAMI|nr:hypothetical protein F511_13190 [Dorcoceras hygrometricum]